MGTVLRRLAWGWRPRLLLALLLSSAITLAAAAAALLSPLENRLRESAESALKGAVAEARSELSELRFGPEGFGPEMAELRAILGALRRQQDAQPTLINEHLEVLGPPREGDFDIPPIFPLAAAVLRTHHGTSALHGDLYILARPVRIAGQRYVLVVLKHLDYVASAVGTVETAFLEAAAVGLGIALILGIALSGRLVKRLRALRDAAHQLERKGPATPLAVQGGRDEIGELANSLRSTQARLADQEKALRSFIATASHELRTPLASLEGLLELVAEDLAPDRVDLDDARERTGRAREQARRLAKLATDLLDLSRLDSGVELRREPVELGELARAVCAELELRARTAGVALRVSGAERQVWALGDPGALARILRILLDNALRFAPAGSAVEVTLSRAEGRATLAVADEGPGVEPAERELIFERFRRGSGAAKAPGFGLGLAIGQELATRMGGSLTLSADGAGATFVLSLAARAPLVEEAAGAR